MGVPTWLSALPFIETLQMDWGTRLVPVDELERFVAERRREAREERRRPEIVDSIRDQHGMGKSLSEIARGLNADGVWTSQGGRQWGPSTVRAVLVRPSPPNSAAAG